MLSHSFGEGFAVRKLHDAFGEIFVGVVFASRDHLTDDRKDTAEIELVELAKEPISRLRELQDGDLAAGFGNPSHFGQALVGIGHVSESERHRRDLKRVVLEGQLLGVGLDVADAVASLASQGFVDCELEHLVAEIGTNNGDLSFGGFVVRKREVARSRAHVEDRILGCGRNDLRRTPTPIMVDITTEKVVKEIIARGDVGEHRSDASFAFIKKCRGHSSAPYVDVKSEKPVSCRNRK